MAFSQLSGINSKMKTSLGKFIAETLRYYFFDRYTLYAFLYIYIPDNGVLFSELKGWACLWSAVVWQEFGSGWTKFFASGDKFLALHLFPKISYILLVLIKKNYFVIIFFKKVVVIEVLQFLDAKLINNVTNKL